MQDIAIAHTAKNSFDALDEVFDKYSHKARTVASMII
jgi:hypothetical protein